MSAQTLSMTQLASVNGVVLNGPDELISEEIIRQRACAELLRQAAQANGLLAYEAVATPDGVQNEAATQAIETLLEQQLVIPTPSDEACQRYYEGNPARFTHGEAVEARHILFAVTEGVDVNALRQRAESTLLEVRCHDGKVTEDIFAKRAASLSNCPSGAQGGQLGWLSENDCAPEFAKELFGSAEIGVLPRLVNSRFGFHVVEVIARKPGVLQNFDAVKGAIVMRLQQQAFITALRQYLGKLSENAELIGVSFDHINA